MHDSDRRPYEGSRCTSGSDPLGYCLDGECGVGQIDREDAEFLASDTEDFIFTD
jgi:hypothetical protein